MTLTLINYFSTDKILLRFSDNLSSVLIKYLPNLQQAAFQSQEVSLELKLKLSNDAFIKSVKEENEKLQPLLTFIQVTKSKKCSLADAVDAWHEVPIILGNSEAWRDCDNKICSTAGIMAYSLDSKYRGQKLSPTLKSKVNQIFLKFLKNNDLLGLIQFRELSHSFGNHEVQKLSNENFWKFFKSEFADFAEMGLKFTALPASSYSVCKIFEQNRMETLNSTQTQKLEFLRNGLKLSQLQ